MWAHNIPLLCVDREKQKTPAGAGATGEWILALSKKKLAAFTGHRPIVPRGGPVSRGSGTVSLMGFLKILLKLLVLLLIGAAIAGVVALVKKPAADPVSFEHWPDVPRKVVA